MMDILIFVVYFLSIISLIRTFVFAIREKVVLGSLGGIFLLLVLALIIFILPLWFTILFVIFIFIVSSISLGAQNNIK
jgi:hypothetical protein